MILNVQTDLPENRRKYREGLKGIVHKVISWSNERDLDMIRCFKNVKNYLFSFNRVYDLAY